MAAPSRLLGVALALWAGCVDAPPRLTGSGDIDAGGDPPALPMVAPTFRWARTFGGSLSDEAYDCDASGAGVHVVGYVSELPQFKDGQLPPPDVLGQDAFVARYSGQGDFDRVSIFGAGDNDAFRSVVVVEATDVYVGGSFRANVSFGAVTLVADERDGVVVKLGADDLEVSWPRQVSSGGETRVLDLAYDSEVLYVAGHYGPDNGTSLTIGACSAAETSSDPDIFAATLEVDDGGCSSLPEMNGPLPGDDRANAIVADDGALVVGGVFNGAAAASESGLVSRLTPDQWVFPIENDENSSVDDLVKVRSMVCAGGTLRDSFDFGDSIVVPASAAEGFVTCRDPRSGDPVWTRGFGGRSQVRISALAFDGDLLYAAGTFDPSVTLGDEEIISASGQEGFIVALDPANGDVIAWTSIPSTGMLTIHGMDVRGNRRLCIAGSFDGQLQLGDAMDAVGGTDGFVAAYDFVEIDPTPAIRR